MEISRRTTTAGKEGKLLPEIPVHLGTKMRRPAFRAESLCVREGKRTDGPEHQARDLEKERRDKLAQEKQFSVWRKGGSFLICASGSSRHRKERSFAEVYLLSS